MILLYYFISWLFSFVALGFAFQTPGQYEALVADILKITVPATIASYVTYRFSKPKTQADIDKTYSDTITGLYAKLDEWIKRFEENKKEHLATLEDLSLARRELDGCKSKNDKDCKECLESLDKILFKVEVVLSKLPEFGDLVKELKTIRDKHKPLPGAKDA